MTLQNRVDPWSKLNQNPVKTATPMDNRGILHNKNHHIVRSWKLKTWISANVLGQKLKLSKIDQQLHLQRIDVDHQKNHVLNNFSATSN